MSSVAPPGKNKGLQTGRPLPASRGRPLSRPTEIVPSRKERDYGHPGMQPLPTNLFPCTRKERSSLPQACCLQGQPPSSVPVGGGLSEGLRCTGVAKAQGSQTGTAGGRASKGSGERQAPQHLLRSGLEKGGPEGEASPPAVAPL